MYASTQALGHTNSFLVMAGMKKIPFTVRRCIIASPSLRERRYKYNPRERGRELLSTAWQALGRNTGHAFGNTRGPLPRAFSTILVGLY